MKNSVLKAGLAVAMTLGLAAPVFAVDPPTEITVPTDGAYGASVTVTGELKTPTIKITVPKTSGVTVNPLGMEVTIDGSAVKTGVISAASFIASESDVGMNVSLTATGTPKGELILGTAAPTATTATKTVYMYTQLMQATGSAADAKVPDVPSWGDFDAKDCAVVSASAKALKNAVVLEKGTSAAPSFVAYRLTGAAAATPTKAWAAADGVDVNLAFTFTPIAPEI